jgi:hypothetical protein
MTERVMSFDDDDWADLTFRMDGPQKPKAKKLDQETQDWLDIRKKAALEINPEIAEVDFIYAQTLDPYGVYGIESGSEFDQVGREYFARNPDGVWVHWYDLPEATRQALQTKWQAAYAAGWDVINRIAKGTR